MATNAPAQIPQEEQILLVRGSEEYKEYIRHQGGWLKVLVNRFEANLATAGRILLLIFLIYTTIKTGLDRMGVVSPIWLEILMLALQVGGVEGAVPGLSRQQQELLAQNKADEAKEIGGAIKSTRWLAFLTGVEIGLSTIAEKVTGDGAPFLAWILTIYSVILLIARLLLISKFLIAMAKIEHKGPKIISKAEHDRMQADKEQEQIRLDNAAIQSQIDQALTTWKAEQDAKALPPVDIQAMIEQSLAAISANQSQALDLLRIDQQRMLLTVQEIENSAPEVDLEAIIKAIVPQLRAIVEEVQGHFPEPEPRRQIEARATAKKPEPPAKSQKPEPANVTRFPVKRPEPGPQKEPEARANGNPEERLQSAYEVLVAQSGRVSGRALAKLAHVNRETASKWLGEIQGQSDSDSEPVVESTIEPLAQGQ